MSKNGTSPAPMPLNRPARDWRQVPCLIWQGCTNPDGYGERFVKGRKWRVHRFAWTEAYGPIPAGLSVCHHCDTPACHEPLHLFLGTQRDNMQDALAKGRFRNVLAEGNAAKTHCPKGHPYVEGNIRWDAGARKCKACISARGFEARLKKKRAAQ